MKVYDLVGRVDISLKYVPVDANLSVMTSLWQFSYSLCNVLFSFPFFLVQNTVVILQKSRDIVWKARNPYASANKKEAVHSISTLVWAAWSWRRIFLCSWIFNLNCMCQDVMSIQDVQFEIPKHIIHGFSMIFIETQVNSYFEIRKCVKMTSLTVVIPEWLSPSSYSEVAFCRMWDFLPNSLQKLELSSKEARWAPCCSQWIPSNRNIWSSCTMCVQVKPMLSRSDCWSDLWHSETHTLQ